MLVDDAQLDRLVSTFVEHVAGEPPATAERRERYFDCLNRVQRYRLRFRREGARPVLTLDLAGAETRAIIESLLLSEDMRDAGGVDTLAADDAPNVAQRVSEAEDMLRSFDPTAGRYIGDLVGEIILLHKDGYIAGSFWHVLGVIWMSPGPAWHLSDYAEALLHESVHQSMFLTDMVRGLFRGAEEELRSPEMLVMSPIRGVRRPYDAAFHAATVSTTLVNFHEWTGLADRAREFSVPLLVTLAELYERRHILTETGEQILDRMMEATGRSATFQRVREATRA